MAYKERPDPLMIVALAAVVLAAAMGGWYYWNSAAEAPVTEVPVETPVVVEEQPTEPEFPLSPTPPEPDAPEALAPLPPLDESDSYFELELGNLFGSGIAEMLVNDALIEKFVVTIDNLTRPNVAERVRPVDPVSGPFLIDGQDGSGQFTINPANYDRYDLPVTMLSRVDRDELVALYRRFYPLFEEAYRNLGYPDAYFNDRLVEVIDHLLAAPEVEEPISLVRPHVLYEYEDPDLEALSAGQKLMIRIGSEHAIAVKQVLEEIRERITETAPE